MTDHLRIHPSKDREENDFGLGTQRLFRKLQGMDLYTYYSCMPLIDRNQNFERIRAYIQCMDLRSILANMYKIQLHFFLYILHLNHKVMGYTVHVSLQLVELNQGV